MMQPKETKEETKEPTIALAMPWCPWLPERVESRRRLKALLCIDENLVSVETPGPYDPELESGGPQFYREFPERLPNDQWSEQVFDFLADSGADWCLQIQEDALVPENVWPIVRAILAALPPEADIVGLHVCDPIASALAEEDVRLFTTADRLVGVFWAMRGSTMREFRDWRRTELKDGWRQPVPPKGLPAITEDTMIGLFAMATGRRIYHPIPAPVDHDTTMASVWGNDDHANRRPRVSWKDGPKYGRAWDHELDPELLEGAGFWMGRCKLLEGFNPDGSSQGVRRAHTLDPNVLRGRAVIPHVGRSYEATPGMARRWVKGFGEKQYAAARADTGDDEKRRLVYVRRGRATVKRKRVLVCTPTRGDVHPEYSSSMLAMVQLWEVDLQDGFELLDSWQWHENIVRVRSRFVRAFLETSADYLHFRDADIKAPPQLLRALLLVDRDFVTCPYPKRDDIAFDAIEEKIRTGDPRSAEQVAYRYSFTPLKRELGDPDEKDCVEIQHIGLGCALLKRELLQRMVDSFRELDELQMPLEILQGALDPTQLGRLSRPKLEQLTAALAREVDLWRQGHLGLVFDDKWKKQVHSTVALFQLMARRPAAGMANVLLGEDTAFCQRVRDLGGKVWMYLGPGSPVDHIGEHIYRGMLESLHLARVSAEEFAAARAAAAHAPTDPPPELQGGSPAVIPA